MTAALILLLDFPSKISSGLYRGSVGPIGLMGDTMPPFPGRCSPRPQTPEQAVIM